MLRTLRSIVAAAALATGLAAAAIAVPAAPASAAACTSAAGVTVVVDPQQLGGGVQEVCDAGGAGKSAATVFEETGFHQSYTPTGMVCQVNGQPSGNVCSRDPQATAYWSLWWSDGTSGWVYASVGAGSLKVPAGGSVAWTWQGQSTKHQPSVAPAKKVAAAPTPAASSPAKTAAKPKPKAVQQPVKASSKPQPSVVPTTADATPSTSVSPSASASASSTKRPKHTSGAAASASAAVVSATLVPTPSAAADAATTSADSTGSSTNSGLPGWVPPVVIAVLAVVAGGIALARRRKV